VRDAIVFSTGTWERFNVPERISLALASLGCKVLHCEPPVSILRSKPQPLRNVGAGIHALRLAFLSSRFNHVPGGALAQARALRDQIERAASECGLRDPIFFYGFMSELFPICVLMKRDHFIVHICMDHSAQNPKYDRLVEISDKTLVIPRSCFHKFRAKYGEKIDMIPQSVDFTSLALLVTNDSSDPAIADIPRPRLGYLGEPSRNLNRSLLASLLKMRPHWHFLSLGPEKAVPLPNAHTLPWMRPDAFARYLGSVDVGFMPYDCYDEERLHGIPLKMFEYFTLGIPVVSTPLIHLWQFRDVVYFGDTAEELCLCIEAALSEPPNSPKRTMRIETAREHSLENLATVLLDCLPLAGPPPLRTLDAPGNRPPIVEG